MPAFRRAAAIGDGFIYAGSVRRATEGKAQTDAFLRENDRDPATFGNDYVTLSARSIDDTLAEIEGWRDAGGTHVSVCTMGMGLDSIDAHIDYIATIKSRLS